MNYEQRQSLLNYFRPTTGIHCNPDGIWGPTSTQATRAFQKAYGLKSDGLWGPETENKIKEAISKNLKPNKPIPEPVPDNNSKNDWKSIKYFNRKEFGCKCGKYCNGFPVEPSFELARILDKIRGHFGKPVIITSGIRCKQHNANVGGVSNSQHLYGIAADIQVPGVPPATVAAYAETLLPNTGGIGRYKTFTHIDVRRTKSRWNG